MITPSPITQRGVRRGEAEGFAEPFGSGSSRFVYLSSVFPLTPRANG